MSLRVFDPTAEDTASTTAGMPRLQSLAGRTIGLLDNGKFRVREFLDYVAELLYAQYGVAQVVRFRKPDASRPVPPDVLADMQRCAAVISAVGD